jgi:hypothetical protein
MFTIKVPRDVTPEEVTQALRDGLGPEYNVLPGTRMTRIPFTKPHPDNSDNILVGKDSNRVWRAQVKLTHRSGRTDIRISPGGVLSQLVVNTFGIARKARRVLLDAPGLR